MPLDALSALGFVTGEQVGSIGPVPDYQSPGWPTPAPTQAPQVDPMNQWGQQLLAQFMRPRGPSYDPEMADIHARQLMGAALMGPDFYKGMSSGIGLINEQRAAAEAAEADKLNRALTVWSTLQRQKELAKREEAERAFRAEQLEWQKSKFERELEARAAGKWSRGSGGLAGLVRGPVRTETDEDGAQHKYQTYIDPLSGEVTMEIPMGQTKVGEAGKRLGARSSNWLNAMGEQAPSNYSEEDAEAEGFRPIDKSERKFVRLAGQGADMVKRFKRLLSREDFFPPQSGSTLKDLFNVAKGEIRLRTTNRVDPDMTEIYSFWSKLPILARMAQEVGNLAVWEQTNQMLKVPLMSMTRESAMRLIDEFEREIRTSLSDYFDDESLERVDFGPPVEDLPGPGGTPPQSQWYQQGQKPWKRYDPNTVPDMPATGYEGLDDIPENWLKKEYERSR